MVQGGDRLVKYLLFFFNLLFVITGLAVIIVGAVIEYRAREYYSFLDKGFTSTAVLLIVVGVIIFLIAFFGCCGAIKENHCMVLTFSVLLFIIFIMEFSAGAAAYVYRGKFKDALTEGMEDNLKSYYSDKDNATMKAWDDMQKGLHCCGVFGPGDYANYTHDHIPDTCCDKSVPVPQNETCTDYYTKGCAQALFDEMSVYQYTIGGVGIGIAFVQLVGIVFACCLARAIKKQYEVV